MGVVLVVERTRRACARCCCPVYAALGLDWDPATTGDVAAEAAGVTWEQVRDALLAEYAREFEIGAGRLDEETLELAARAWRPSIALLAAGAG